VKLRAIESLGGGGVKLRVFEDHEGYFKTASSSGGSCEVSPIYKYCVINHCDRDVNKFT
jgi:hypothetical protein